MAYYIVENVPFKYIQVDTVDDTTGDIIESVQKPETLSNVVFIALNTLACQVSNTALYETTNDPGQQLTWLENKLVEARANDKTVIIAGNMHPGSPICNRQWSHRYSALIDAF